MCFLLEGAGRQVDELGVKFRIAERVVGIALAGRPAMAVPVTGCGFDFDNFQEEGLIVGRMEMRSLFLFILNRFAMSSF